jgi:hypothetical protein
MTKTLQGPPNENNVTVGPESIVCLRVRTFHKIVEESADPSPSLGLEDRRHSLKGI